MLLITIIGVVTSFMLCQLVWKLLPHSLQCTELNSADCAVVDMATRRPADCQKYTLTVLLHAHTKAIIRWCCCRLQGTISHSRDSSQSHVHLSAVG